MAAAVTQQYLRGSDHQVGQSRHSNTTNVQHFTVNWLLPTAFRDQQQSAIGLLLHCVLASCGAVYCNQSCLWVCDSGRCPNLTTASMRAVFASLWALFSLNFHFSSVCHWLIRCIPSIAFKNFEKSNNQRKSLCAPLCIDSWEIWRKFHGSSLGPRM